MKLSCALVLTLTNLVIATPYSFSVKGSGASAKAEAATSSFGQFGVVKPVAPKTTGFSGSFSKSSSSSVASSSASSSSSAFNYNAGQIGYGSQDLLVPHKNVEPQVATVPQATAFATAGTSQTGASVNAQATGSYSSEKENNFSGNTNSPANVQYQSAVPEGKPNFYVGINPGIPSHWHEQSKPNSFNANVPEKTGEQFGVQSFSGDVQSGTAFFSTPAAPSKESALVENAPSYSGGFGGPPGLLSPHDKISSVASNAPSVPTVVSYPPGAPLNVPSKQQTLPVTTVKPSYAQYQTGNINPTVQSINTEYVYNTENSKPLYKPEIKPTYLEQNTQTASGNYNAASSQWQHDGQHVTLQPHAEIAYTTHKELEQGSHSFGQVSQSDKPFAHTHDSKPIKNVQIFIQPVPSNAPQTVSKPVYFTNTQVGSENKKEVKPINQLSYPGGFGEPAEILKPSGQTVSSGQIFSSSPVKVEQYESSAVGLTGTKESTFNTGFGGSLNEVKETAQPSLQSTNVPKPSSSSLFAASSPEKVSYDYVSTEQKGTDQFSGKPSESSYLNPTVSSWEQNPTFNSLPIRPEFVVQKKPTGDNFFNTPSPSPYSPEQGLSGIPVSIDKTKPTTPSGSFGQVPEVVKPTIPSTITNNGFASSNTPYKPVVTPTTPQFDPTKQKESSFVYFTTQSTPVNSWQQSTYKPSFDLSTPGYFNKQETSPTKYPSLTGDYTVSKQSEQYPSGTYSTVNPTTADFQVTSNLNQQSANYGSTAASFITREPTAQVNSVGPTSISSSQEPTVKPFENTLAVSSVSQFSDSPKTSSPQSSPTGTFTVSKEVYKVPTQVVSNTVYPPGSVASVFHLTPNSEASQFHSNSHKHQQLANYGGASSFVTQKPTTVNFVGQTPDATSGSTSESFSQQPNKPTVPGSSSSTVSQSTTFAQQSPNKPSVDNFEGTVPVSGAPSKNPQYQFATKPTAETRPQKQSVYSSVFGTLTGAVKPSSYSSPSSTSYPGSSSNSWSDPSYLAGSNDKPKQTNFFNQNKPSVSSFPEKKETLIPTNPTAKPSLPVASTNVVQQSSSSITNQNEKESTATATSGSGTTYSKPTSQPTVSNSGVSYTSFASPKPTKPTNQFSTSYPAVSTFGSSTFSQVKPQYQFSTIQPVTQKKQWYTNNYGTFGAVKPHSYPGFSTSFTTFGQGSVGGLYDKTKQNTQYTSTGQYKPTITGQYNPSLTGQYKPTSTGQYKPTNNWGLAGQSQFQKPSYQSTQTGGSYVSTYTQTTSKPFVTLSSFDKQKVTSGASVVNQKESSVSSSFASSSGIAKPTNQPFASFAALKPTSSGTSFESGTGFSGSSLTNVSDKGKVTSSIVSTTSKYDVQKPVNPTVQTVSNTYVTSSFISAKPTSDFQTTGTPSLGNKPTYTFTVQQQYVPSVQTVAPTKDAENFGQSTKPVWSSSNQKESAYASNTGVATGNLNPTTQFVDGSDNSHFVDKTQTIPVRPTNTGNFIGQTTSSDASGSFENQKPLNQFSGQVGSTNEGLISAQKNPSYQQSGEPFSSTPIYQGNTESYLSNSQVQPASIKPGYTSTGESSHQSTPPKSIAGNFEANSGHKESAQHVHNEHVHSKPTNAPYHFTSQSHAASSTGVATSQFSTSDLSELEKAQYLQTAYNPSSAAGFSTSFETQQNSNPKSTATSQENYSNIAVANPNKPSGQYWVLNSQSQQTDFQATKPNIKITVVGKPVSNIASSPYSGGFGGPSGILKPNQFGIPSQGIVQATSDSYSGAKVETDSKAASYSGGFGAPSGVLRPDEKHSIHQAGHNKPSLNGFQAATSQGGSQTSYHVEPTFQTSGAHESIKEQAGYGTQASSDVQGTSVANVASAASNSEANAVANAAANGFANSNAYASSAGAGNTGSTFGGINGFSASSVKESATASATASGSAGSFTTFKRPLSQFAGSPGDIARLLGRR
ncbi:PREDICTED: mucin-2-like [Papilio xuthus]|uniref:Mucin-2-like n=1 Tax=Papilio xuthus TaxID=66420 RepID=A0AAJ6ZNV3_PAPXU|nr:PREDICTED: mucin-2-like [Papilio xuthus]